MKKNRRENKKTGLKVLCAGLVCLMAVSSSQAAGLMKAKDHPDNNLHLGDHHVEVILNNGFAQTIVDQTFRNSSDHDLEAVYTFPLPKQASLSEVSLWVGERELTGEVVERKKARKIYEDQQAKGNDTALAEKNDFKSFDVMVGNVRAGSEAKVRLVYYQPLEVDLNVGRYLYPLTEGNTDDARIPFWSVDDVVTGSFSFKLTLKSAFPIKDVRMPGRENQAQIEQKDDDEGGTVVTARFSETEAASLADDVMFYYRLDDTAPARVEIIPYKESAKDPGTFMMVVTPAADLKPIQSGSDWLFLLDVSGSMSGGKIATLADGVSQVLGTMNPEDRFKIITFNNSPYELSNDYIPATAANVANWINKVKTIQAGGGTALFAGLKAAYRSLDEDRTTGLIVVTDGVANVGPTQHKHFLELQRKHDVRLFTFIIGNGANQPLMDKLAKSSNGFAMNVSHSDDIQGKLLQAKAKILNEAMHGFEVKFSGERVSDLTPSTPAALYVGDQHVSFGRYNKSGDLEVTMTAKIAGEKKEWKVKAHLPEQDVRNPEIERLWALSSIEERMQEIREHGETVLRKNKVVDISTEYSIVSDYTSMLVIDDTAFEEEQIQRRNKNRVHKERTAQAQRNQTATQNNRVDQGQGTFGGRSSNGIGTGPVGPLFIGLIALLKRFTRRDK